MSRRFVYAAAATLIFCGAARASEFRLPSASYIKVGAETSMPYGWMDFCNRRPEECNLGKLSPRDIRLTSEIWALLNQINGYANKIIVPVTNLDHWGTLLDHWDYPVDGMGDCKVFALFKRKLLIEHGLPRQALLMTIVRDLNNEGHAILTVKTDHGEFVLDNLSKQIRPWDATGYLYVKRQAQYDPNVWLDLGGVRTEPAQDSQESASAPPLLKELPAVEQAFEEQLADSSENANAQKIRSDWSAQVETARLRHDAWLACIVDRRSDCDLPPLRRRADGLIVDDGLPPLNVG
jgi:predicted transglutaminase-like cysteine proteinase